MYDSAKYLADQPFYKAAGGTKRGYKSFSLGAGSLLTYNTRDVLANTCRNMYLDSRGMMCQKFLGSDNSSYRLEIGYHRYKTLRKRDVLTWTTQNKNVLGGVPLNEYVLDGTPFDLRGCYMKQYHDKPPHVVMAGHRQMINTGRGNWVKRMLSHIGYVTRTGCGFIDLNSGKIEGIPPNMGMGLHMEVQPRVNIRLGLGRNMMNEQNLFHFNMTEVF